MSDSFTDIKVIHTLPWNTDAITTVAFIGNDKVAAGNRRGDILVWNLSVPEGKTPDPVRKLAGHSNEINRIIVTPDGRTLISASSDHTVKYWDAASDQGEPGTVVLNDGFLPKGVTEKLEKIPDPPPPVEARVVVQKPVRDLTGHTEWVQGLTQTPDGRVLVTGDDKGLIIVWDLPSAKELRRWQAKYSVRALGISPDGKTVASSDYRSERHPDPNRIYRAFHFWDAMMGQETFDLTKDIKETYCLCMTAVRYSADGKWLACSSGHSGEEKPGGKLMILDPATGKKIRELTPGHDVGATDLVFHPDGRHLFSSGRDQLVRLWQIEDGKHLRDLGKAQTRSDWINALSISPDGRLLAAANMVGQVVIYSLTS